MNRRFFRTLALLFLCIVSATHAQPDVVTRDVILNLDTPWEILWGPDGWIWMTERGGRISRVNPENGEQRVLITIADVHEQSESGLLGMALHPSFPDSSYVYVVYNYSSGGGIAEKLVRYRYTGQVLVEPDVLIDNVPGFPTHDGSRLLITPDGKLLMTTGDAQNQPGAQSQTQIVGKILRMNLDGTAPSDNPWPNAPYPTNLLWTTGHRNPQGLAYGPTGILYSSEHGPNNDDEINIIERGRNYGWPNVHGYCDLSTETQFCADSSVVEPIRAWTPTLATAGIAYYGHTAIPAWQNSLLLTNLKEADLRQLKLSSDGRQISSETVLFNNVYGRLRDVAVAPDGRVFIATSNRDGRAGPGFPKATDDRIVEIRSATSSGVTISAPVVTPMTIHGGEQIQISFDATGPFTTANVFTAQLSDAAGSFAAPIVLGTLESLNGGIITTTLPCSVPAGTGYRVRIVSSNPAETSPNNDADIVIAAPAAPAVTPAVREFCAGGNIALTVDVPSSARIRWTPSEGLSCDDCPNPTAGPTTTTTYLLTVTNELGCDVSQTITVTVNPIPTPTITREGDVLVAPEGFIEYRWSNASGTVVGLDRTFSPFSSGTFTVAVLDSNGCTGTSAPFTVTDIGGIVGEARDRDLRLTPSPARDHITVELALRRAGAAHIEIVDMRGATVRTRDVESSGAAIVASVDLGGLAAGAYIVRITSGDEEWVRPIVKE
jgi:aldose sugar dehydrogenase